MTHTRLHPPTVEVRPFFPFSISKIVSYFLFYFWKELQADVARQQRVLANVALIEARDRAEEQERLRIRQEDQNKMSQRVLAEFHPSVEQERSGRQNDSADGTKTTGSHIQGQQKISLEDEVKKEIAATQVLNSDILSPANGPKIRPPTFLTPAKSPKSQTTTTPISTSAFSVPPGQSAFGRKHQCQQKKADTEPLETTTQSAVSDSPCVKTQKSTNDANRLPMMPSRVTETESWVPKAKARRG